MKPLNPSLFWALKNTFGKVDIGNQGDRYHGNVRPNWNPTSKRKLISYTSVPGEYYKCSCWLCNDTRQRLWINHMWGVREPATGDDRLYLAHCFNEGCIKSRKEQEQLRELVYPFGAPRRLAVETLATPKPASAERSNPITLPDNLIQLTHSSAAASREYLANRGFDPQELSNCWNVWYSAKSDGDVKPFFSNRIVIPIYSLRVSFLVHTDPKRFLAGWQARSITAHDSPKYLTAAGMKKSAVLYGLPQASKVNGPIVLCEGVRIQD